MGSVSKAWIVAASVGLVESLKDQGFCRWNQTIRSVHQHTKNNLRSIISQANKQSSSSSNPPLVSSEMEKEKAKKAEESLRELMCLTCWGPN